MLQLYRPVVAQRVGRGIALLFQDRSTRKEWLASSTPQLYFTRGKDPVPIVQEAGWAPGPVWTGGKSRPHWDSIRDRPSVSRYTDWATRPTHVTIVHVSNSKKAITFRKMGVHPSEGESDGRTCWVGSERKSFLSSKHFELFLHDALAVSTLNLLVGRLGKIPLSKITLRPPTSD